MWHAHVNLGVWVKTESTITIRPFAGAVLTDRYPCHWQLAVHVRSPACAGSHRG
jgi:hypothetical protein